MNDRRVQPGAAQLGKGQPQVEAVHQYTPKHTWDRFDEAVYDYAQECALIELEQEGCVGPPGDVQWAKEYMLSFFLNLDEDVFKDVPLDRDYYVRQDAEYRFVVEFRSAWSAASGLLSEEFG